MHKVVENNYIIAFWLSKGEQPDQEYNNALSAMRNRPTPENGFDYKLRADTLEWERVELPPAPEPSEDVDDSEALNIILGGAAE